MFRGRRNVTKTIHPLKLQALLEAGQPAEMVEIRPRAEYEKVHIEGAHSIPSAEISVEKLVRNRELLQIEPIYLVSESAAPITTPPTPSKTPRNERRLIDSASLA